MKLTLAITNRCNMSCPHCFSKSTAEDERHLSVEEMKDYIDQAAAVTGEGEDLEIRFTGGEPFIRFDHMLETVRYASSLGARRIGCTTNAFWAKSPDKARELTKALKAAGQTELRLSCDQFHQFQDNPEPLRNAFEAANEAQIPVVLKMVVFRGSKRAADIIGQFEDLTRDIIFHVEELSLLPAGRAESLDSGMFFRCKGLPTRPCNMMGTYSIDVEHDVYPCCVPGWPPLLHLGNGRERKLTEILSDARNNPLLEAIRVKGPAYFVPFLEKAGQVFPRDSFVNYCHLCQRVFHLADKDPEALEAVRLGVETFVAENRAKQNALNALQHYLS